MKRFLAMHIGCIECGEDSKVIGVFKTHEEADEGIRNYADDKYSHWREDGLSLQEYGEVFEIECP